MAPQPPVLNPNSDNESDYNSTQAHPSPEGDDGLDQEPNDLDQDTNNPDRQAEDRSPEDATLEAPMMRRTEEDPKVGRRLQFEPEDLAQDPGPRSIGPTTSVVFFDSDVVERGPSRRDSQAWNAVLQQATKQAESMRTPIRGSRVTQPEFKAQNKFLPNTNTIYIDGRAVPIATRAKDVNALTTRLYDKTKRSTLTPESLQAFLRSAITYVLPKGNKLSSPPLVDAEGHLKAVNNLGVQLRLIKRHLTEHDMIDVFTIVFPKGDVRDSPEVSELVSLFDAYPRLHPAIVANSNTWYHLWASASYLAENMNFSYELLRKNTEDDLWLKCQEDYEEYSPPQRGGPLMLFLILRRIQDVSESAIDHVKQSLTSLRISDIPGEDVDRAVSLIKSAHALFKSASSSYHCYIPEDFPKLILELFQTSSVPEFNQAFKREQELAQHQADKTGQMVQWPTVQELTSMATNSYKRLSSSNQWLVTPAGRRRALTAGVPDNGPRKPTIRCWNCSGPHPLTECDKPKDQAKIDAARKAFAKAKRERRAASKGKESSNQPPARERKIVNGKPMIKNKKGVFVLDQKVVREQALVATTPSGGTSTETPAASETRSVSFANTVRTPTPPPAANVAQTTTSSLTSILRRYSPTSARQS